MRVAAALALGLALAACGSAPDVAGATLPTAWLVVGNHRVSVELAVTPETRARGLMFRESLPEDHGMLFVYPGEAVLHFWMKNTQIPLSIAYADAGGRIVEIADMQPRSLRPVSSRVPARYALEMEQGWFTHHGVGIGDKLARIPRVDVQ